MRVGGNSGDVCVRRNGAAGVNYKARRLRLGMLVNMVLLAAEETEIKQQ